MIGLDIETYSSYDLKKCGVYKYAEAPDFEILLLSYTVDDQPTKLVDLARGETLPDEIITGLLDDETPKWAFNAGFERVCLSRYFRDQGLIRGYLKPDSWYCSLVLSAYNGLPLSLKDVGKVLKLDDQKMEEGKDLIRYFCMPCKPTKSNGGRTRNLPENAPEKWELFKTYNVRDVDVEKAIRQRLMKYNLPSFVWDEYHDSEEINDRGIMIDDSLARSAVKLDLESHDRLAKAMQEFTGLKNPNSVAQLKEWLKDHEIDVESIGKKELEDLIATAPEDIKPILRLRQQISKSSVKKYTAMLNAMCEDGRCHGMFFFYGASRSGRFAGRIVQLQNLYRNSMPDLSSARAVIKLGTYESADILYDSIPEVLAQLVRTAFIPKPGCKFIVADYSSIEARVLAFLAHESHTIESFARGEDIYCATASAMFGVPVVKHGINGELRQKGKIATLACVAEGQPVLTDRGLVPIEDVNVSDRVWDGDHWVYHDGVIYKGEKEVMTYEGLTATGDHYVYVDELTVPVPLKEAMSYGFHLRKSGIVPDGHGFDGVARVYDILNAGPNHRFTVSGRLVHNCGYGGSVGALKSMGAIKMGIKEEDLQPIVDAWRASNPHIVQFWHEVDRCIKKVIHYHGETRTNGIRFVYFSGMLFIILPSGRRLSYVLPSIGHNRFGGESITYWGINNHKWTQIETFGGKIVENIIQAVARDILCYAIHNMQRKYHIVAHVHDEVICEVDKSVTVQEVCEEMSKTPPWIKGLLLRADGYECEFYKKD